MAKGKDQFKVDSIIYILSYDIAVKKEEDLKRPLTTIFHFAAKKSAPESIYEPLSYF